MIAKDNGSWDLTKITKGDLVKELLVCRNYESDVLVDQYKEQMKEAVSHKGLSMAKGEEILCRLTDYLEEYPYLT